MLRDRLRAWGLNAKNVRRKVTTNDDGHSPVRRRGSIKKHSRPSIKNAVVFDVQQLTTIGHECPARPVSTFLGQEPTHLALRAVACFLDVCCVECDQHLAPHDPMWTLMRDYWQGFYFMDIGDTILGMDILRSAGPRVRDALQSRHPAALLHPLQTLCIKKFPKKKRARLSGMPQQLREAVMADGRLQVIKCMWCDDTITSAHFHCHQCSPNDGDICFDCSFNGRHCLDNSHVLQERFIHAGTVVQHDQPTHGTGRFSTATVDGRPNISKEAKLAVQSARQASSDVMPVVLSYLVQESRHIHGSEHPMTLLLQAFHILDEVDVLCDGIVRLLCNKFLSGPCIGSEATVRLLHSCAWILLELDQHQQLEHLYHQWKEKIKVGLSWDMTRILALSKMEQGLFMDAERYLIDAWSSLCERGQPMPDRWLKLLGNRAYLHLLMGKLPDCRSDLEKALECVDCNPDTPLWHRSHIVQLYEKLRLREEAT